jgi:hypothetical protein
MEMIGSIVGIFLTAAVVFGIFFVYTNKKQNKGK